MCTLYVHQIKFRGAGCPIQTVQQIEKSSSPCYKISSTEGSALDALSSSQQGRRLAGIPAPAE